MRCPSCGSDNEAGRKFCGECGSPLAQLCVACGAANGPTVKFCGECGTPLTADAPAPRVAVQPASERRLVSVLFADLVGFTAASEGRDSEETRELLSRYFETARTLVERYGGTVEKFIGDAVMAVWGTPGAQEDDAERAVRAALDLVAAVPGLDEALRARAGVLTGEAAVTLGAQGQGMVAGDLVNTVSRIQTAAEPGTVLVGEATKRASDAAVAYEDAGEHSFQCKAGDPLIGRCRRLRGRERAFAEGQGRARAPLAGAARDGCPWRRAQVRGARAAVRGGRPGAPPDQRALPRLGRGGEGSPRLRDGHWRARQVAACLGVPQVPRRPGPGL